MSRILLMTRVLIAWPGSTLFMPTYIRSYRPEVLTHHNNAANGRAAPWPIRPRNRQTSAVIETAWRVIVFPKPAHPTARGRGTSATCFPESKTSHTSNRIASQHICTIPARPESPQTKETKSMAGKQARQPVTHSRQPPNDGAALLSSERSPPNRYLTPAAVGGPPAGRAPGSRF